MISFPRVSNLSTATSMKGTLKVGIVGISRLEDIDKDERSRF
jgi:hypothetical protein